MTLAELDRRRAAANEALERLRKLEAEITPCYECGSLVTMINTAEEGDLLAAKDALRQRETDVLAALREWWAQVCRESALG
jgi:hypothetical protein